MRGGRGRQYGLYGLMGIIAFWSLTLPYMRNRRFESRPSQNSDIQLPGVSLLSSTISVVGLVFLISVYCDWVGYQVMVQVIRLGSGSAVMQSAWGCTVTNDMIDWLIGGFFTPSRQHTPYSRWKQTKPGNTWSHTNDMTSDVARCKTSTSKSFILLESLFFLLTLPEHIDFHIIGYWMSSIWSLWQISLEETRCRHIGYAFW